MKKVQFLLLALTLGVASLAHAQATRTWVSGVGDDANPCSRTAPCKTFAGAISKTANGGIINAIDSAGFGAVTIGKSITIDATPFMGGVLQSGANGIIVNGISTDKVTLRGLDIEGVSAATNGIRILTAAVVVVENCQIYGFQRGISVESPVASKISVFNTTIKNNSSHGIGAFPTGGVRVDLNIDGCRVINNGGNGLEAGTNVQGYVTRSNFSVNSVAGIATDAINTFVAVESTTASGNQFGIFSGTGGASTIVMSRCIVTKNTGQGVAKAGDGSGALGIVTGFQNNVVTGNAGSNAVTSSVGQI
jgi:hypothetical protein